MNEVIVSVRMPKSMADELKRLARLNHYLDISEEVRSIIRDKSSKYSSSYNAQVRKVVDDLRKEISKTKRQEKQELLKNLRSLLEEVQDE